jgi:hypothetical protein
MFPRPFFNYINDFKYQKHLTVLLILAGITNLNLVLAILVVAIHIILIVLIF